MADIVDTVEKFVREWRPPVEGIVPAPASLNRKPQPVIEIAAELAQRLALLLRARCSEGEANAANEEY